MKPVKSLAFDPSACGDLAWWIQQDRKKVLPLVKLIKEVQRIPCPGTGKPEALKHELAGCWSRRIDDEYRLVYAVQDDTIRILACRYHY